MSIDEDRVKRYADDNLQWLTITKESDRLPAGIEEDLRVSMEEAESGKSLENNDFF